MTRTAATAFSLFLALCMTPGAAAGQAAYTASSLQAVGPDPGQVTGGLEIFLLEDLGSANEAPPVPPFMLDAKSLHVEVDRSEAGLRQPGGALVYTPYNTTSMDFTSATLEETASWAGYRVDIVPALGADRPQVRIEDGCFRLGSTPKDVEERESRVNGGRPHVVVDLSQAALATACGGATLTLTGSFAIHLWETDVLVRANGQTQSVRSGHMPAIEGSPGEFGSGQEVYITAHDATFRTPFTPQARLFLREMVGDVDGTIVLENAHGQLQAASTEVAVEDETLELRGGPLHLVAVGHGTDPMQISLDGGWREASLDGQTFVAGEPGTEAASAAPLLLAVVVLAAAASRRR